MKQSSADRPGEETYSSEVKEILKRKPSFLVRNGISLLLILVVALIVSGYFIPYPERLSFPVTFVPDNEVNPTGFAGIIRSQEEKVLSLQPQQKGILILDQQPDNELTVYIKEIKYSEHRAMCILFVPEQPETIQPGDSGQATFVVGTTNMLFKLLTPFLSLLSNDPHN